MKETGRPRSGSRPAQPDTDRRGVAGSAMNHLRKQLIDTSKRSRLVNTRLNNPRSRKQLDICDEKSDEVFRRLFAKRRFMRFKGTKVSLPAPDEDAGQFYVPALSTDTPAARHTDHWLQTALTEEALHKRLLALYRDARSFEEEQGVSVLFLALGFVKWYESESSDKERYAPLILLPVDLKRDTAKSRFKIEIRDQDLEPNFSFKALLKADFEVVLPDLPDSEAWLPSAYYDPVAAALSAQPRWRLLPDVMQLGFYSFAKFLMYNDLEGADLEANDHMLDKLLVHGFEAGGSILPGGENLDRVFSNLKDLGHILEADASQTRIIDAARRGTDLVVQGPPGTGKSQTIANIIAGAVGEGKTVLFVAEKRAALDVVHARLQKCDLAPVCLELHSHKISKRHVYAELKRTLELGEPTAVHEEEYAKVAHIRDRLNETSAMLHAVDAVSGQTPFNIMGVLSNLKATGLPRPDDTVEGIESWSSEAYAERQALVEHLAALTERLGTEDTHLWRGAESRLGPIDQDRLADTLVAAAGMLDALRRARNAAFEVLGLPAGDDRMAGSAHALEQLAALQARPEETDRLLRRDAVLEEPHQAHALLATVAKCQAMAEGLLKEVARPALKRSWELERSALAAPSNWLMRWFSPRYRKAKRELRSVCKGKPPRKHTALVSLADRLIEHDELREAVRRDSGFGRAVAGRHWKDEHTDTASMLPAARWVMEHAARLGSGAAVVQQLENLPPDTDLAGLAAPLQQAYDAWNDTWRAIVGTTKLDDSKAFGAGGLEAADLDAVQGRLRAWSADVEGINDWHQMIATAREASRLGMDGIRKRLASGTLAPEHTARSVTFIRAEAVWKRLCREQPALGQIDGRDRTANVEQFKRMDRMLQQLSAQEAMRAHFLRIPPGASGAMGLVRGEAGKKSRHMSIRMLMDKAAEAVQRIKPVFLMSPLSVAQYLPRGKVQFDMLLIDEASQVRPADAMGAIMRARQVIVVGDQKQLPPTAFFDRQVSEDMDQDLDIAGLAAAQAGDMESILSLCEARGMQGGMLEWHYRSSHPSLIAVSNHSFYDDRLICPPSPTPAGSDMGLTFTKVTGEYLRGTRRTNPKEADAVVQAVLEHARKRPGETLGVVALSVAQRDEIRNKIEFQRTRYPELEAFCNENRPDPFFVKNLENVQGDERDAIFVSIGYGRDAGGYMSQSFGPISSEGGERRLNVLFTRSKKRCRIFSSIRHSDIRLDAARHLGPRILARFLKYAETGEMDIPAPTGGGADSPFEESVQRVLELHGYRVASQVGSAGFRIDLAVCDPEDEGRYILAVECDGARYHSSSWARERDRLRQNVLESKGWTFHRIWSTDWFQNQKGETTKLIGAVERARSMTGARTAAAPSARPAVQREEFEPDKGIEAVPYEAAVLLVASFAQIPIHETSLDSLAGFVRDVVDTEGPMHLELVRRRINAAWGNARMGSRIRPHLDRAIARAVSSKLVRLDSSGQFADRHDRDQPVVPRDRSGLGSSAARNAALVPPSEIRAAVLLVISRSHSAGFEECAKAVARLLGFKSLTKRLRERIEPELQAMIGNGTLVQEGDYLYLGPVS